MMRLPIFKNNLFSASRKKRQKWAHALLKRWQKTRSPFFDHRIDELRWPENIYWVERGVLPRLYMPNRPTILDLCCGDGYYSDIFWSSTASHIDAVDRNDKALSLAMSEHAQNNISYYKKDIVSDPFPGKDYDIVCFFEAIEHFSQEDGQHILSKIKSALKSDGKLVGSTTLVKPEQRGRGNYEHDNEFENLQDLHKFLGLIFQKVTVLDTHHPNRRTAYFICE